LDGSNARSGRRISYDNARAAREKPEGELAELQSQLAPLQSEVNQITRQFRVTEHLFASLLGSRRGLRRQYDALVVLLRRVGPFDVVHGFQALPSGLTRDKRYDSIGSDPARERRHRA
jgi:hypothetical protein